MAVVAAEIGTVTFPDELPALNFIASIAFWGWAEGWDGGQTNRSDVLKFKISPGILLAGGASIRSVENVHTDDLEI